MSRQWWGFVSDLSRHFQKGARDCRRSMSLVVRGYVWEVIGWVSVEQPAGNDNGTRGAA